MLPVSIAALLKEQRGPIADYYESVTILFADIVGFTKLASANTASVVVEMLNRYRRGYGWTKNRGGCVCVCVCVNVYWSLAVR